MISDEQFKAIQAWEQARNALTQAKETEAIARADMLRVCFPYITPGTNRLPLYNGYAVKAIQATKYELDANKLPDMHLALQLHPDSANHPELPTLIKYTPEISVKVYKKLSAQLQAIVNTALTTRHFVQSVEIEQPKEDKQDG